MKIQKVPSSSVELLEQVDAFNSGAEQVAKAAAQEERLESQELSTLIAQSQLEASVPKEILDCFKAEKLFAHIHLDDSANNSGYEGLQPHQAVSYLSHLVKHLQTHASLPFLEALSKPIEQLHRYETEFQELIGLRSHAQERGLSDFAMKAANKIWDLPVNESYLVTGGYHGTPGHAMYYQFQRTSSSRFTIYVYNVQQGSEESQGGLLTANKKIVQHCMVYKDVPVRGLFFADSKDKICTGFIKNLIGLRIWLIWNPDQFNQYGYSFSGKDQKYQSTSNAHIARVFQHLEQYIVEPPRYLVHFLTAQRSGICCWRSLNALVLGLLVQQRQSQNDGFKCYKTLMFWSKFVSLQAMYQYTQSLPAKERDANYFQLGRAAQNFLRLVGKYTNQDYPYLEKTLLQQGAATAKDLLSKLGCEEKQILHPEQNPAEAITEAVNPGHGEQQKAKHEERLSHLEKARKALEKELIDKSIQTPPLLEIETPEPDRIITFLDMHLDRTKSLVECSSEHVVMTYIEEVVKHLPLRFEKDAFWDGVRDTDALQAVEKLYTLACYYREKAGKWENLGVARSLHTHISLLVMAFECAKKSPQGDVLRDFSIDFACFQNLIQKDRYFIFDTVADWEKRQELLVYFKNHKASSELFCFHTLNVIEDKIENHPDIVLYKRIVGRNEPIQKAVESWLRQDRDYFKVRVNGTLKSLIPLLLEFSGFSEHILLRKNGFEFIPPLKAMALQMYALMGAGKSNFSGQEYMEIDKKNGACAYYTHHRHWGSSYGSSFLNTGRSVFGMEISSGYFFSNRTTIVDNEQEFFRLKGPKGVPDQNMTLCRLENESKLSERDQRLLPAFTEPVIQSHALLDYLMRESDFVFDKNSRELVDAYLFKPTVDSSGEESAPLLEEIRKNETGFWAFCQEFVEQGIRDHYRIRPGKIPKLEGALFYVRFSQKLTRIYKEVHGSLPPPLIDDEKEMLGEWLALKSNSISERKALHVHRIAHYLSYDVSDLTDDDWVVIYCSWCYLQTMQFKMDSIGKDKLQIFHIQRWMNLLSLDLKKRMLSGSDIASLICKEVLAYQGLSQDVRDMETLWEKDKFPLCRYEESEGEFWEINLSTGAIRNQFGIVQLGEIYSSGHPIRLFKDRDLSVCQMGRTLFFNDTIYGQMRIVNGDSTNGIQRKIKGQWYMYLPYDDLSSLLPPTWIADYSHWAPLDPSHQHILFDDLTTGQNKAEWKEEGIIRDNKAGAVEQGMTIDYPNFQHLTRFEELGFIRLFHSEGKRHSLVFPRYETSIGDSLEFTHSKEKKAWVYCLNPNYALVAPIPGLLDYCKNYLTLQHVKTGHKKIIVPNVRIGGVNGFERHLSLCLPSIKLNEPMLQKPMHATQTYFEIDVEGEHLRVDSPSGKLFLASLFLNQKNYLKAYHFLNQITINEKLSQEAKNFLTRIFYIPYGMPNDNAPDALSIRLQAYILYRIIYPFESNKTIFGSKNSFSEFYSMYLHGWQNVDQRLLIDPHLELEYLNPKDARREYLKKTLSKNREGKNLTRNDPYDRYTLPKPRGAVVNDWRHTDVDHECYSVPDPNHDYYDKDAILKALSDPVDVPAIFPLLPYPTERFSHDFRTLKKGSYEEKQELIYLLQTVYPKGWELELLHVAYIERYPSEPPSRGSHEFQKISFWKTLCKQFQQKRDSGSRSRYSIYGNKEITSLVPEVFGVGSVKGFSLQGGLHQTIDFGDPSPLRSSSPIDLQKHQPDALLRGLREECLQPVHDPNLRTYKPGELTLGEGDLSPEEMPYKDIIMQESAIYEHEYEKGIEKINDEANQEYQLKSKEQIDTLVETFEDVQKNFTTLSENLKQLITRIIFARPTDEKARLLNFSLQEGRAMISPTLMECLKAVATGGVNEYRSSLKRLNQHLTNAQADELRLTIIHYLIQETANRQVNTFLTNLHEIQKILKEGKPLDCPEIQGFWKKGTQSLAAERTYDPLDSPQVLLFEFLSGLTIRPIQAKIIRDVFGKLFNTSEGDAVLGVVFQLIMGGGKTSVILSILLEMISDEGKVPLFLCHHSQYSSVLGNLKHFQKSRFGKDIVPVVYTRQQMGSIEVLKHILKTFRKAKQVKNPIIMPTPMLQSLQLELESTVADYHLCEVVDEGRNLYGRISTMIDILRFIQSDCLGVFDEVDINLSILLGVHFPKGLKKHVNQERIALVKSIYQILATDSMIEPIVGINHNQQADISLDTYKSKVLPQLAKQLVETQQKVFRLDTKELRESCQRFFENKIPKRVEEIVLESQDVPRGFSEGERNDVAFLKLLHFIFGKGKGAKQKNAGDLIALSKQILLTVLPLTLSKSDNRSYGRAPANKEQLKQTAGKVVPYLGVGTPATTEFGYIYELLCYHFQTVLSSGVSLEQVLLLGKEMTEAANFYAKKHNELFDKTAEAKEFLALTRVPLDKIEEEKYLREAVKNVNASIGKRLLFEQETANYHAVYYSKILSSNSLAVVEQLWKSLADSGTIWNASTYHMHLQHILRDEGTEGKIITVLLERFLEKNEKLKTNIYQISSDEVQTLLKEVFEKHPQKERIRAITDVGGLLKRYDTLTVAKEILTFFDRSKEIEAVLFLYRHPKTHQEKFALLKKGTEKPLLLENSSLEEITKYGIPHEKIFIFHDELRTTGTDIPEIPEAINLITIDPQNILIRGLLQGMLRAREYFLGQNVDFVVLEKTALTLIDGGKTVRGILKSSIKNQAIQKARQTFRAYKEEILEIMRSAVIDAALQSEDTTVAIDIFQDFEKFVFTTFEDNPYEQYSYIEGEIDPTKLLERIKGRQLTLFKELNTKNQVSIKKVEEKLGKLFEKIQGDKSLPSKVVFSSNVLPTETQVEINQEMEQPRQQEADFESELELQQELQSYCFKSNSSPRKEVEWKKPKDKEEITVSDLEGVGSGPLRKIIEKGYGESGKKEFKKYEDKYELCFPEYIQASENFIFTANRPLPVFHPLQKPVEQILVYREKGILQFMFLSKKEVNFFRQWIEEDKPQDVWLMNSHGHLIESRGQALPSEEDELFHERFQEGLWYANYFNGHVDYLLEHDQLTEAMLEEGDTKVSLRFLELRANKYAKQLQLFGKSPLFHPFDEEFGTSQASFVCEGRRIREEEEQQRIAKLSPEEIAVINPKLVPYIMSHQVRHLTDEKQVRRLRSKMVKYVTLEQVNWLPEAKIQFLETKEQVQALTQPEKIHLLQERHMSLISEAQIPHIDENYIPYLPNDFVCHVDPEKYDYLQGSQVGSVPLEKINYIPSNLFPFVTSKDQIEKVDRDHLHLLKTSAQVACISPRFIASISESQWKTLAATDTLPEEGRDLIAKLLELEKFTPELVKHYSEEQVQALEKIEYIQAVTSDQVQWLKPVQFKRFLEAENPEKLISHLTLGQLKELDGEELVVFSEHLFDEQILKLDAEILTRLSVQRIKKIEDLTLLRKLPLDKIQELDHAQYVKFTAEDTEQIHQLSGDQVGSLTAEDTVVIQVLTMDQIPHLQEESLNQLSEKQIRNINDAELIRRLPINPMKHLTLPQMRMLDPAQDEEILNGMSRVVCESLTNDDVEIINALEESRLVQIPDRLGVLTEERVKFIQRDTLIRLLPVEKIPFVTNLDAFQHGTVVNLKEKANALTHKQLQSLTSDDTNLIQALDIDKLMQLKYSEGNAGLRAIIPDQIRRINDVALMRRLKGRVWMLDPDQFEQFTSRDGEYVESFSAEQARRMTEKHIHLVNMLYDDTLIQIPVPLWKYVTPERLSQIKSLNALRAFPLDKVPLLTVDQLNSKMRYERNREFLDKITKDQVAKIPPEDTDLIHNLPQELLQYLSDESFALIQDEKVQKFNTVQLLRKLSPSRVHILSTSQLALYEKTDTTHIQRIFLTKVKDLTERHAHLLEVLTDEQIESISTSLWGDVPVERMKLIRSASTIDRIAQLGLRKLTTAQAGLIQRLNNHQIKHLPEPCFSCLTNDQVKELDSIKEIRKLPSGKVSLLTNTQVALLEASDTEKIQQLIEDQFDHLPKALWKHLTTEQVAGMSDAQVKELDNIDQIRKLALERISALTEDQIRLFDDSDVRRIQRLTQEQLAHLSENMLKHTHQTQISALNDEQLINRIPADKIQYLSDNVLSKVPLNREKLLKVEHNRLHHLNAQQIHLRNIEDNWQLASHIVLGLIKTVLLSVRIIAETIYNLALWIFQAYKTHRNPGQENLKKLRECRLRTLIATPWKCLISPLEMINPALWMLKEAQIEDHLQKKIVS
ncbi:MAG: hypothetical protein K940chlam7_00243 [Chlamydiae bacterium]|nr:hypothetical protein [Chlamydiota bacterium]